MRKKLKLHKQRALSKFRLEKYINSFCKNQAECWVFNTCSDGGKFGEYFVNLQVIS